MRKNALAILLSALIVTSVRTTYGVAGTNDYPIYIAEAERNIIIVLNKINNAEQILSVDEYVSLLNEAVHYLSMAKKNYDAGNTIESVKRSNDCNEITFQIIRELNESLSHEAAAGIDYTTNIRIILLALSLLIIHYTWLRYRALYLKKIKSYGVVTTE